MSAILAVTMLAVASLMLAGCTVRTIGSPEGPSLVSEEYVVTLIRKQDPYVPSLHRDTSKDRYGYFLLLTPLDGGSGKRLVSLLPEPSSTLPFGLGRLIPGGTGRDRRSLLVGEKAQLLGVDGNVVWILRHDLLAYDLRAHRLVGLDELRGLNPAMEQLWAHARYDFVGGHLRVASPDLKFGFQMDPETLKGSPTAKLRSAGTLPESPASYLCDRGELTPGIWLGLETQDTGRESRRSYRIRRGPDARSAEPVPGQPYLGAAFLRASRNAGPLRLSNPDGFVMAYQSGPWPTGSLTLARVGKSGQPTWLADTRIAEVEQYLPGTAKVVVRGKGPKIPDKVQDPVLAIVDTATGAISVSVLWQHD